MQIELEDLIAITAKMNVLYAEDDIALRENTSALLSDLFHTIEQTSDGLEAFALYTAQPDHYDIVITDLNMPHMNGIELIKKIQELNPLQAIIIISAHNETEYFLESIRNNVNGYILKPIEFDQLMESLYKTAITVKERKENIAYKENLQLLVKQKTVELEENYQKMHEFLTIDKITQLQNATMLFSYLDHHDTSKALTLMLYNIDDFNHINKTYGIEFGDNTLKKVGEFLKFNISEEINLFKYNSDEFVIVFEASITDPVFVATQIQAFFRETPIVETLDAPLYITLSCGISTSQNTNLLLSRARIALKEAHLKTIPNQYNIYENIPSSKKSDEESTWLLKFREALEQDRVIPFFQPIINNHTQKIVKYECLARIEEEGIFIGPAHFLEAARRTGLMSNLTRCMINKCFKMFSGHNDLEFSINITTEDLMNNSFIDFLEIKQIHYGIQADHVIFEVLEDIIISDHNPTVLASLQTLKKRGYKMALDDFGSDRSNYKRLKTLGADFIKIDGQFIKDIDKNSRNQSIVASITDMAHSLDIKVIAEFVSTFEEFTIVNALGVDFSQGYFFNKPLGHLI
ncbi:MAG: EAL domain-containing protein [Sulfurospirillaceae bacterium]|nr:EAL domain-containing protein [Sulfurospirillaceae bacterium]MDD2826081.1 EAL domain-containing protein [Sulfurospirillaceae bacterium]